MTGAVGFTNGPSILLKDKRRAIGSREGLHVTSFWLILRLMDAPRDALYTGNASQSRRYLKSPGNRDGVSQRQAVLDWELSHPRELWELELAGKLVGIHVDNKIWYSRAQLRDLLGPPKWGPDSPAKMERPAKGG
jgi:hypothetical protein